MVNASCILRSNWLNGSQPLFWMFSRQFICIFGCSRISENEKQRQKAEQALQEELESLRKEKSVLREQLQQVIQLLQRGQWDSERVRH